MAGGKKADRRGHEPRHIRLYHSITGSAAWRDLSGNAIKVLVALLRFDKGGDNGGLFMSVRTAAEETGLSENTAWKALRDLEDHGFIAATDRGHFARKQRPATQWRVTWQAAQGRAPTRDFEKWQPIGNKTRSQKLMETVANIETVKETFPSTVAKIGTASTETSHFSNIGGVSNTATQIVCHGHSATDGWKQNGKHTARIGGPSGDQTETAIREKLKALLQVSPAGTQTRLATDAAIPGGTLSKFIAGSGALPEKYRVPLSIAVAAMEAADGRAMVGSG